MKKNLRLLCLGLAAATFTCSFAQEPQDMTDKLKNADMEQGLKGWVFDGTQVVGKNTKNVADKVGFHGMSNGVQEAWNSNPETPLGDSYVMQRLKDLPSGTYVFGAYAAAAKQNNRKVVDGKEAGWSNRDSIDGVVLFANKKEVRVAADNPDMASRGDYYKWAHSSKFNVAVTLAETDELKGYLDMGLRVEGTNANYVVWDNATLYYFGDMSEEAALDAMAEIDMANAVAIADTLVDLKMHVDTLENLQTAINKAKKETTTAATLWDDSEDLFYNMGLARKSITDYENLKKHIESATVVMNGTWGEQGMKYWYGDLVAAIEYAEETYEYADYGRADLNDIRAALTRATGWLRVDSLYTALDVLTDFVNTAAFTGAPGAYSVAQQNQLKALESEVRDSIAVVEGMEEELQRPQDLYPYIARIYAAIESVENNPIPLEYSKMPVEFKTETEGDMKGWIEGAEWHSQADKIVAYNSPMYRFESKITTFRITVKKAKNGSQYFCLSGLTFYDGNGAVIPLTEEDLSTEYDHNTLNPGSPDGDGIAALFDGDNNTYFHSAWQNSPAGEHYLDVILPNGGYDSFSFQMLSRSNSNGWDQSHTFPGEMTIDTPKPLRDELKVSLEQAKALAPYCGTDPGFYVGGEEALDDIAAAIAEAEALIANNAAEAEMPAAKAKLDLAIYYYDQLLSNYGGTLPINLPEEGKVYRVVSGFPGYFEKQSVEKALTVHAADTTLWWENVCADSLQQEFVFNPVLGEDGEPFIELVEEGTNDAGEAIYVPYYCYTVKNVRHELYLDSAFTGEPQSVRLVEEACDTVKLKWLGRGQWNIILKGQQLHCGDHNSGNPSTSTGAYGGVAGVGSRIVPWATGIDGASAWYIREYPELPLSVLVENGDFKSDCIHFDATDSLTLTADAACAFENLKLYDLYGSPISFDVKVEGAVATIKTASMIPACAFAFNNAEGVSTVTLDIVVPKNDTEEEPADLMATLEEKLEAAAAIAPEEGTGVGQYDDLADYEALIAAAEAMLEGGAATDDEVKSLIKELEMDSITTLLKNPHMPEAGKYYFIASGLAAFEKNLSYNTELSTKEGLLTWGGENYLDWTHYWQFEPVSVEELKAMNATDTLTTCAFYIKNVGTKEYIGHVGTYSVNCEVPMTLDKSSAAPYKVSMLNSGTIVALDNVLSTGGQTRLHFNGHGGGTGKSGNATYWNSGLETASAMRIVETEFDMVNIDFTEVENDEKVSAKGTYDLFGRRVVAPAAPGIYIIDGKKKVVK